MNPVDCVIVIGVLCFVGVLIFLGAPVLIGTLGIAWEEWQDLLRRLK